MKTFEELCPNWFSIIQQEDFVGRASIMHEINGHRLSMGNYSCCVVGEAHGFNEDYVSGSPHKQCGDCLGFAMAFCDIRHDDYQNVADGFIKHWNEVHEQ